jgi:hypothetical protein
LLFRGVDKLILGVVDADDSSMLRNEQNGVLCCSGVDALWKDVCQCVSIQCNGFVPRRDAVMP